MKRFLIAVVMVVGLIGLVGTVQQKLRDVNYGTVKAQQFLLTDSKGNVKGGMSTDDDGNPTMRLVASSGAIVELSATEADTYMAHHPRQPVVV